MKRVLIWSRYMRKFTGQIWYFPLLAFLVALDLFVLFIPSDFLLVGSVMIRPKSWVRAFLWAAVGSALGALALSALLQLGSEWVTHVLMAKVVAMETWQSSTRHVQNHGPLALAVIALSPLPQQPAVAIAALAHLPLATIAISVFVGRFIKYGFLAYVASHSPKLLSRLPMFGKVVKDLPTK